MTTKTEIKIINAYAHQHALNRMDCIGPALDRQKLCECPFEDWRLPANWREIVRDHIDVFSRAYKDARSEDWFVGYKVAPRALAVADAINECLQAEHAVIHNEWLKYVS